jgi:hypothetical protein
MTKEQQHEQGSQGRALKMLDQFMLQEIDWHEVVDAIEQVADEKVRHVLYAAFTSSAKGHQDRENIDLYMLLVNPQNVKAPLLAFHLFNGNGNKVIRELFSMPPEDRSALLAGLRDELNDLAIVLRSQEGTR